MLTSFLIAFHGLCIDLAAGLQVLWSPSQRLFATRDPTIPHSDSQNVLFSSERKKKK